MPLYIAPYIGTGTRVDPLRPAASGRQPRWSAIQTRSNTRVQKCFLWLPLADPDAALVFIADDLHVRATDLMRSTVTTELGLTADFSADQTPADIIGRALMEPAPAGGATPIVPTRRNLAEVWLREELIWSTPVIRGGASYSTNFTGADENPLSEGGKWGSGYAAWAALQVITHAATIAAVDIDSGARLLTPLISPDQYSRGTCLGGDASVSRYCGLAVRMHPSSTTDSSCYAGYAEFHVPRFAIYEVSTTGTITLLLAIAAAPVSSTLYTLEVNGSTLTLKSPDGVLGTVTDSTITSGQPGIVMYGSGIDALPSTVGMADWDGGDLGQLDIASEAGLP